MGSELRVARQNTDKSEMRTPKLATRNAQLFPDMLQADIQQPRHMLIIQGIINNRPIPAAFNQSQVFEAAQLMRHSRFAQSGESRQITHAHLYIS